ncbi:hypothetical protein LDENG_00221520 [Lucifuga dentata]|nr:hypothetical protein LDENG_00221520 [Lucifuga dentata]
MDLLALVRVVACLLLFFGLFGTSSGDPFSRGSVVYTHEQLLALCDTKILPNKRPEIPKELRRRRRGFRAGAKYRERRRYKPCVPSVIMGNVRSLANKMEELTALSRLQWEYQRCSMICYTETWLNELTPDSLVTLDGFHLVRANRSARETGKRKGGGIAMFVNERWCHPGHISEKQQHCTKDIELLAVSIRPYYLPREFSHVVAITAYIPPLANAAAACECIHTVVSQLQTLHPQSLILISGDFSHVSLSATLSTFPQYVGCHTRDNKTLDLLYANTKDAYSSSSLPPLGCSDHNLVHLVPAYTSMVSKQPPTKRVVREWSEESSEALRDCFETTDWEVLCRPQGEDIDSLTHCIMDYINFCVENTVPTRKVWCFSNNKPWVTPELKALLNDKKRAFRMGDKEELRRVQKELKYNIRRCKDSYRRMMEEHLQQNNAREVWRGLEKISGHNKGGGRAPESGDQGLCLTPNQVRNQLMKTKARKAAGPDGISSRLLRDCADQLYQVVLHIFNLSLSLARVPVLWKTSCVVPVLKTAHPREPNHFRPVGLTSYLMKTMERLILNYLHSLVSSSLGPLQFTYQPGIGVDDAIIYLLHRSLSHLGMLGAL